MNLSDVGGQLKRERERRRLSLRDVMEATKISRRNLNALEAGDADSLPHSVYLKGYVRNYARLVGLDPEPLVAVVDRLCDEESGYLSADAEVCREPAPEPAPAPGEAAAEPVQAEPATEPAAEPTPEPTPEPAAKPAAEQPESFASQIRFPREEDMRPRKRRRLWPWIALAVLVAALGFSYVQYLRLQAAIDEALPTAVELKPAEANATSLAANATDNATANATEAAANATLPEPAPAPKTEPAAKPAAPVSGPGGATPPVSAVKPATPPVPAPSIEVTRKPQAPAPAPEQRTPGTHELVVTAKSGEECWVELSEGAQRKSFILRNGESRRFEFQAKAKVRLGNAGGVSFQLNGAHYPYEGERGQTATVEIGPR